VRLFVALELCAPARTALGAWGAEVAARDRALRATAPTGLHLTLAFLGARPPADVAPLEEALPAAVAAGPWPADLAVGSAEWLPERRPSVLTVAVLDPEGTLAALQARVVDACREAVGWEPERRRFRPHVTVARLRRGSIPRTYDVPEPPGVDVPASGVTLFSSVLEQAGARHEALARALPG
jgi:2'-5' RNA ligase